jgi:hypothetical protein
LSISYFGLLFELAMSVRRHLKNALNVLEARMMMT